MKKSLLILIALAVIIIFVIVKINTISRVDLTNNTTNQGTMPITTTENQKPESTDKPQRSTKDDLITVDYPTANAVVESPLTVTGEARGTWYFEASFPVQLLDANDNVIASAPAQAQGDWMTTDYVPFSVTLTFPKPSTDTGTLVLKKDNPSGLPQNENELRIPVRF